MEGHCQTPRGTSVTSGLLRVGSSPELDIRNLLEVVGREVLCVRGQGLRNCFKD